MTSRLESLPPELLDPIVDLAGPSRLTRMKFDSDAFRETVQTYSAISLTSRTLSSFGQSYLYRSITTMKEGGAKIQPLLRTLSRQPALAAHVKELHLWPSCDVSNPMSADDLDQCWLMAEQMIGRNALSLKAESQTAQPRGCRAWEMAILLALTTKLTTLIYLDDPEDPDDGPNPCSHCPDMGRVLMTMLNADLGSRYPRLQGVCIAGDPVYSTSSVFSRLDPPLAIPSVTKLVGVSIGNSHQSRLLCAPRTSNISNLHLRECRLDAESISQLLSACKALERVTIDWDVGVEDVVLDARILLAALQRHEPSLKVLIMSDSYNPARLWAHNQIFGKGLGRFSHIATLFLEERLLFGNVKWTLITPYELNGEYTVTLPPALRNLIIHSDQHLEALPNMLAAIRPNLPTSARNVQILFEHAVAKEVNKKYFNKSTFERVETLEWSIHETPPYVGQLFNRLTFQCFADNRPAEMPLQDVVRLAENGGGIDAVLSYLYRPKHDGPGDLTPRRVRTKDEEHFRLDYWESRPLFIGDVGYEGGSAGDLVM